MCPRVGGSKITAARGNRRVSENGPARVDPEVRALKVLLFLYILLGLCIAGVNFGWAPKASEKTQTVILTIWQVYENQFKTALIIVCSVLTLRVVRKSRIPRMRRFNLIGMIAAALVIHIAGPLASGRRGRSCQQDQEDDGDGDCAGGEFTGRHVRQHETGAD